jgi:hypothetical protein
MRKPLWLYIVGFGAVMDCEVTPNDDGRLDITGTEAELDDEGFLAPVASIQLTAPVNAVLEVHSRILLTETD